jgi:hypothetical protein
VGGLNTVAAGLGLPPDDCVQAYNVIAAENGLRVRYGEREWCTGLTGLTDNEVRTVIPFTGGATSSLFAATSTGIWDATMVTTTPPQVATFPVQTGSAGWGVFCSVVTAGGRYCLYADEENGLYRYAESGATWTKVAFGSGAGEIDGVDPGNIAFVTLFKGRVWMAERASGTAWYLDAGAISGTAKAFPMGAGFRNGGHLVGLWTWTYDGGAGMDDSLVAWSSGGDILVYQGTDPASASTFALQGTWYAGPPPAGRSCATSTGGELQLLTRQGVVPMSKLVVGANLLAASTTVKVANLLNTLMAMRANTRGWAMIRHPEDVAFLVIVPQGVGAYPLQLAQATSSSGWFIWRDLDMLSVASWEKQLYFGTTDGRVLVNTGTTDGVSISSPDAYDPIEWSLLTATSDLGAPTQKQVGLIRPLILSEGAVPSIRVNARYRYDQAELDPVTLVGGTGDVWDSALWDQGLWAGDSAPSQPVRGATGMGPGVAIAIRGVSISKTVLVGIDVTYTSGGFL